MVRVVVDTERWADWALKQPTPVLLLNDGLVRECNDAACHLFDLPETELVGVPIADLLIVDIVGDLSLDDATEPVRVLQGVEWIDRLMVRVDLGDTEALGFSEPVVTGPHGSATSSGGAFAIDAAKLIASRPGSGVELAERVLADASDRIGCALLWSSADGAHLLRRSASVGFEKIGVEPEVFAHRILAPENEAFRDQVAVEARLGGQGAGACLAVPVRRSGLPVGALVAIQPIAAPRLRLDHAAVVHAAADQLGVLDALIRAEAVQYDLAHAADDMRLFASALAHDLRAPIRHIAAFGEIVRDDLRRGDAPDLDDVIDNIDRILASAARATEQLNDLVDYVRGADVTLETVEVSVVVAPAIDRVRPLVADAGGAIVVEGLSGMIHSDPAVVGAILDNLLENAVKYRDPDRLLQIRVHSASTPRHRIVHVTDNGLGLPEGREEMAFAAFRRLHPGVSEQGSGMGLALSRRMTGLLHGELTARRLPEGTRFSLALPRAD